MKIRWNCGEKQTNCDYVCLVSLNQAWEFGMNLKFCTHISLDRDSYSLTDIIALAGLKCSEKCQNGGTCVTTADGKGECK